LIAINENGGEVAPAAEVCNLFNYKRFSAKKITPRHSAQGNRMMRRENSGLPNESW
jgi:hypothetical protein